MTTPLAHDPATRFAAAPAAFRIGAGLLGLLLVAGALAGETNTVGLSAVRAQRFGNEAAQGFGPGTSDFLGFTLVTGDFDGDRAADLAAGMPSDNGQAVNPILDSGTVVVRYGAVREGLGGDPVYLRHLDAAETGDQLGHALAACDLNRDGYDDLAVGVPFEDYLDQADAGIVQVHFGYTSGLPPVADTFFAQSTSGVQDDVEEDDRFGWSLACADFDRDGFDDLVVGSPGEKFGWDPFNPLCPPGASGCKRNVGRVHVVPGSLDGLDYSRATVLDQDTEGIPNENDDADNFGAALVAADFDGDGYADLAIGAPGEDDFAGGVAVVFGGPGGLHAVGDGLFLGENVLGGTREDEDSFGLALAAGDLDRDGFADLAIGIPGEDADASIPDSGQVGVLYGAPEGFDMSRPQLWTETQVFGGAVSESGDLFGWAVTTGDFDRDGIDDLAIGHPGETVVGAADGTVTVLMGSEGGLLGQRRRSLSSGVQGTPGNPAQSGELFGYALASADFDGDAHDDLAISSPGENEAGIADVGAETVLYGALFADGVESGNTALWPQTSFLFSNNLLEVAPEARLGPLTSRRGIRLDLIDPDSRRPGVPAFVRVGPEAGFAAETALSGSFHVDPQGLTMSTDPSSNFIRLMTFADGVGAGSRTHLIFFLARNPADGDWTLAVFHFNAHLGTFQFTGEFRLALDGDPAFSDIRVDFAWDRGDPGRLTMGRTRFVDGVPAPEGRQQVLSAALPGMQGATLEHVFAGMVGDHRPGTFGTLYLDELSFRRGASPSQEGSSPTPPR